MTKLHYVLVTIVSLCLIIGTIAFAEQLQISTPALSSTSGFLPPDTSPISGGTSIGPNPLVKIPVSVQTGIIQSPALSSPVVGTTESYQVSSEPVVNHVSNSSGYAPDRLIVKYKTDSFSSASGMQSAQETLNEQIGVQVLDDVSTLGVEGMQVVSVPDNRDVLSIAKLFKMHPNIEYAEPDYILSIDNGLVPGQTVIPPSVSVPTSSGSSLVSHPVSVAKEEEIRVTASPSPHRIMRVTPTERQQIAAHARNMDTLQNAQTIIAQGSKDLLSYLSYIPTERDQGYCGNCWVWASTGLVEIAQTVQTGTKDRLSIQYFNSNYYGGTGSYWACNGGWSEYFTTFYNTVPNKQFIPWSNTNADYHDGTACSSGTCSAGTKMPASSISTSPNYPINSISTADVNTYGITQTQAINNIKAQLNQNKAVWWGFFLPNSNAWSAFNSFWAYQPETTLWNPDPYNGLTYTSGGGGHAVIIVGYDDSSSNPDEWYWVVLNSWGTTSGRPNGLFRLNMNMDYSGHDNWGPNHYFNVFNVDFTDQTDTGSISASSTPSGAAIWLDGGNTGKVTPSTLTGITSGSHTITLKLSGYSDYQTTVTVTPGGTASVSGVLFPISTTGSVSVSSSPSGASVWLDGGSTGTVTPNTLTGVTSGSHTITLKLSGYSDYQTTVTIASGGTASVSGVLSPISTTGSVLISSSPSGASVYLDSGTTAIGLTPLTKNGVSQGTHTIKLIKSGYVDYVKSVIVTAGKTTSISATLTPIGTSVKPNDPNFSKLYGLHNTGQTGGTSDADIDAPQAWAITRGSPSVIVAVIDTGVDYNHPDLKSNCVAGYDYANNDANPMDDHGHGTHVAGTIAAIGNNNRGVTGVSWNTKIMPLKFLTSSGSGYTSNAIKAINYAKKKGAKIASCSWGGTGTDSALKDAITNAPGILFVCAAGNSGQNTDKIKQSPSSLPNTNILSVAASDARDKLASFSNYGATTVDVAAPGVSILSTYRGNKYGYMSGTSMATPHVSGIAALIKAKKPSLTTNQIKNLIIKYVDKKSAFTGKMVSGGRVNAYKAVKYA